MKFNMILKMCENFEIKNRTCSSNFSFHIVFLIGGIILKIIVMNLETVNFSMFL